MSDELPGQFEAGWDAGVRHCENAGRRYDRGDLWTAVILTAGIVGIVVGLVSGVVSESNGHSRGHNRGYRAGQIDALTGTVKYELVTYPDSTRAWEEIE